MTLPLVVSILAMLQAAQSSESLSHALQEFQSGDDEASKTDLIEILRREPQNGSAHNLLGLVLMKEQQFQSAEREFAAAISLNPGSPASHANAGNALVQLHRDKEAEAEYLKALAIRPQDKLALHNLGLLYARQHRYSQAETYLLQAHQLDPGELSVTAALAGCYIDEGKIGEADSLVPDLLKGGEKAADTRYSLALLALHAGEPALGLKLLQNDDRNKASFLSAVFQQAEALTESRQYDRALRMLEPIRDPERSNGSYHDLLGTIYYELDRPKTAVDELQAAIRLEPLVADHYFKLGMMFLKHRTPEPATYVFQTSVKLMPQTPKLWMGLGLSNYMQMDLATAKQNLHRALSIDSRYGPAYTVLCDLLVQSHQDEELLGVVETAMKVQPDNYLLPYYFGRVLGTTDWRKSISLLQRSTQLNDRLPDAYYESGKILAAEGDSSGAMRVFKKALQLNPNLLEAHYQLGQLYQRQRDQRLASEQFDAVRRIRKDGSSDDSVRRLVFTIDK